MLDAFVVLEVGGLIDEIDRGAVAAAADKASAGVDWSSWEPGDVGAALRSADGALAELLDTADVTIKQAFDYPTLRMNVDRVRAAELGISQRDVANSMLTSIQPTETSAKIGCISEMCEPRRGVKITIVNEHQTTIIRHPHLVRLCNELGLDIAAITRYIDEHDGSIWGCPAFPDHLQLLFRGIYEYDQRFLIDLTSDREAYIDLAQSHSVYLKQPKVVDALGHTLYAHRKLLKTLSYYMRSPAATTLRATGGQYSGLKSLAPRKDESCEGCST